jgi:hypothetical protein
MYLKTRYQSLPPQAVVGFQWRLNADQLPDDCRLRNTILTFDEISGPRLSIEKRDLILSFGERAGLVDGRDRKFENRAIPFIKSWKYRSC